jgi:hypothetical protein
MNEQDLARKCSKWLRPQPGIFFLKVHGGPRQRAGIADYWIVARGQSIQIELKRPGAKPIGTILQEKSLRDHEAAGGRSFVATSLRALQAVVSRFQTRRVSGRYYWACLEEIGVCITAGELREVRPRVSSETETLHLGA